MNPKRNVYLHPKSNLGSIDDQNTADILTSIIDPLTAHVAILDAQGYITLVNEAWKSFMRDNDGQLKNYGIGLNYVDMCLPSGISQSDLSSSSKDYGELAAKGIIDVLEGSTQMSRMTYPCHSQTEQRWFMMTTTPLLTEGYRGAFVAHENVTTLVQREEDTKAALIGTVEAITDIAEVRDPYTAGHQKNVTELAAAISTELGLQEEDIRAIRLAAAVHDIGKISIPSEILTKPGKISEHEMALIRTHAESGYDLLKNIPFPWPLATIVRQHHERIDGSGYPQGIKGEDIVIGAKVIAVADTVDAMVSHRPYRPGLGIAAANEVIHKGKGTLYDREVVEAYFCDSVQALLIDQHK